MTLAETLAELQAHNVRLHLFDVEQWVGDVRQRWENGDYDTAGLYESSKKQVYPVLPTSVIQPEDRPAVRVPVYAAASIDTQLDPLHVGSTAASCQTAQHWQVYRLTPQGSYHDRLKRIQSDPPSPGSAPKRFCPVGRSHLPRSRSRSFCGGLTHVNLRIGEFAFAKIPDDQMTVAHFTLPICNRDWVQCHIVTVHARFRIEPQEQDTASAIIQQQRASASARLFIRTRSRRAAVVHAEPNLACSAVIPVRAFAQTCATFHSFRCEEKITSQSLVRPAVREHANVLLLERPSRMASVSGTFYSSSCVAKLVQTAAHELTDAVLLEQRSLRMPAVSCTVPVMDLQNTVVRHPVSAERQLVWSVRSTSSQRAQTVVSERNAALDTMKVVHMPVVHKCSASFKELPNPIFPLQAKSSHPIERLQPSEQRSSPSLEDLLSVFTFTTARTTLQSRDRRRQVGPDRVNQSRRTAGRMEIPTSHVPPVCCLLKCHSQIDAELIQRQKDARMRFRRTFAPGRYSRFA